MHVFGLMAPYCNPMEGHGDRAEEAWREANGPQTAGARPIPARRSGAIRFVAEAWRRHQSRAYALPPGANLVLPVGLLTIRPAFIRGSAIAWLGKEGDRLRTEGATGVADVRGGSSEPLARPRRPGPRARSPPPDGHGRHRRGQRRPGAPRPALPRRRATSGCDCGGPHRSGRAPGRSASRRRPRRPAGGHGAGLRSCQRCGRVLHGRQRRWCSETCRLTAWHAAARTRVADARAARGAAILVHAGPAHRSCTVCGQPFIVPHGSRRHTCSDDCRAAARRGEAEPVAGTCVVCGEPADTPAGFLCADCQARGFSIGPAPEPAMATPQ